MRGKRSNKGKNGLANPACIVNYHYYEIWGRMLPCRKCPLSDNCWDYQTAKMFVVINEKEENK